MEYVPLQPNHTTELQAQIEERLHRDVLEADAEHQSAGLQLLGESLHGLFLASSTQRALHLQQ